MHLRKTSVTLSGLLIAFSCVICAAAPGQNFPHYRVDPSWPKELPNNWIMAHVQSIIVDKDDHIWVFNNPHDTQRDEAGLAQEPPLSECCIPAPAVLEFDAKGNVLKSWGGPGYVRDWPAAEKGLWVDKMANVWVTGSQNSGSHVPRPGSRNVVMDRSALKFTSDGKLLLEIGHPSAEPVNNQDTTLLGGVSSIQVDEDAHEVYFADGYVNRRVVVYDSETGVFKRGWGAYGIPLKEIPNFTPKDSVDTGRPVNYGQSDEYDPSAPPSKQFRGPLVGLRLSVDGLLYVSDRENDRIQVFTKQGKFVKEFFVAPKTLDEGSVMDIAFSRDPKQKYLLVADGSNNVVWVLNRNDGSVVTKFGHRGHNAGQFSYLHTLDMDSHGNIYTGEVKYNNRLQRFIPEKIN